MSEMLIDGAKLDACLDAEADAIRAKTGDSNDIAFDFANNKGFADAIAAIPTGGGVSEIVTVGENTVSNMLAARNYFLGLSTLDLSSGDYIISLESGYESPIYNQLGGIVMYVFDHTGGASKAKRYRNGTWGDADVNSSFDCALVVGSTYKITALE